MARRTFFSFHYKNDIWRANQVRNCWVVRDEKEASGFIDAAEFEKVERDGEDAVQRWINKQLDGTSVTVVLIGSETNKRPYVLYELEQSWKKGNGILGIYIHQIKDQSGNTSSKGDNSFGDIFKDAKDGKKYFFERFSTYDWVDNDGRKNIGQWIEDAAKNAGR